MNIRKLVIQILPKTVSNYLIKILASDINRNLISGSFWSVFSTIFSKLLVITATILTARILGQTVYGELAIIRSNINLFISFTGLGIALTATKYIAQYKEKDSVKTAKIISLVESVNILAVILATFILFFLSDKLANDVLHTPHLTFEIKVSFLILVFTTLTALQVGILSGFQNFKEIGKNTLISGLLGFFVQILLIYFLRLKGAILGLSFSLILFWVANIISIRKITRGKYSISLFSKELIEEFPILWKFSLPTFLIAVFMEITRWSCNTIMIANKDGFKEMAIFDISYQWQVSINFIPAILAQVALPILSNNIDNKEKYSEVFYKSFKINALIAIVICLIFCLLSSTILSLYGKEYTQSNIIFIYLIICSSLTAINSAVWQLTVASGHMWINLIINIVWSLVLLIGVYLFNLHGGINAEKLAISYLTTYVVQSFLLFIYFYYYQKSVIT